MSDITTLESRISAALERLGRGIDALPAAGAGEDAAAMRTANAQLEERVQSLRDKRREEGAAAQAEFERLSARLEEVETRIAQLARVNAALRGICAELRAANAAGRGDGDLVNRAAEAEIDALAAARAADRAEIDGLIGELSQLSEEAQDA